VELIEMMMHVHADKDNGVFMDNGATRRRLTMAIVHPTPNRPFILIIVAIQRLRVSMF